jgi:hypothetical protein
MYEHRSHPLLPKRLYIRRLFRHGLAALLVVIASLSIGILGYHFTEGLPWIDSLLNASMILGGMGPVDPLHTGGGKLFASFNALFSGIVFLFVAGILMAPIVHRFLHRFHLESQTDTGKE